MSIRTITLDGSVKPICHHGFPVIIGDDVIEVIEEGVTTYVLDVKHYTLKKMVVYSNTTSSGGLSISGYSMSEATSFVDTDFIASDTSYNYEYTYTFTSFMQDTAFLSETIPGFEEFGTTYKDLTKGCIKLKTPSAEVKIDTYWDLVV